MCASLFRNSHGDRSDTTSLLDPLPLQRLSPAGCRWIPHALLSPHCCVPVPGLSFQRCCAVANCCPHWIHPSVVSPPVRSRRSAVFTTDPRTVCSAMIFWRLFSAGRVAVHRTRLKSPPISSVPAHRGCPSLCRQRLPLPRPVVAPPWTPLHHLHLLRMQRRGHCRLPPWQPSPHWT